MLKRGVVSGGLACLWTMMLCVSCDSSSGSNSRAPVCTPGEQRACACPGGLQGVQSCSADGSILGACSSCTGDTGNAGSAGKNGQRAIGGANASGAPNTELVTSGGAMAMSSGGTLGTNAVTFGGSAGLGVGNNATGGTTTDASHVIVPVAGASNGGGASLGGATTSVNPIVGGTASTGGAGPNGVAGSQIGTPNGGAVTNGGASNATQITPGGNASTGGSIGAGGTTPVGACGDGVVNYSEGCDSLPKNKDFGDGCTPACAIEPACPPAGGACVSQCGDGIIAATEACDDGNAINGDGCSSACTVEDGFDCIVLPLPEKIIIPMVVRDFDMGGDFEKGGTFSLDLNFANQGLLKPTLDEQGQRPVLASTLGTYNGVTGKDSGIASVASFAQWFNDAAPVAGNKFHSSLVTSMQLFVSLDGGRYANRFGNNGDGATNAPFNRTTWNFCGNVGEEDHDADGKAIPCTSCLVDDPSTPRCDEPYATPCQTDPGYVECRVDAGIYKGIFLKASFDGNPLFFPADPITPASPAATGQITGNYDPAWPADPSGKNHNFSFTTETRFWFKYDATKNYRLQFEGDDDAWVFVNKHLAIDIGGIHTAVHGDLTLAAGGVATTVVSSTNTTPSLKFTSKPDLGSLVDGGIYEVAVFQAERQTKASSYMLSLSSEFATARSACLRK